MKNDKISEPGRSIIAPRIRWKMTTMIKDGGGRLHDMMEEKLGMGARYAKQQLLFLSEVG